MQMFLFFRKTLVKLFTVLFFTIALSISSAASVVGQYLSEITTSGTQISGLNQPADIAISDSGDIYLADTLNNRVVVFDKTGNCKLTIGKEGRESGDFMGPMALALDAKARRIFVADSSNCRVQILDTNGKTISVINLNDDKAPDEKNVRPIGIVVSADGSFYVSDADNNLVRKYSQNGECLSKIGGGVDNVTFGVPAGLAIDAEGNLYVVDMLNGRFQVFDKNGKFLFKTGEKGDTIGAFSMPKDITIDKKGLIYVSDGGNLVVQVFTKDGKFAGIIGTDENVDSQFASPSGVATNNGKLYVVDRWRNSIRVFETKLID